MERDIIIMNCGLNESSIVIPLDFIGNNLVKILQFFSPYLLVLSHRIPVTSRRVRMNTNLVVWQCRNTKWRCSHRLHILPFRYSRFHPCQI